MAFNDFLDAAVSFPAVLFSFLLMVVVVYWLLVIIGGAGFDAVDSAGSGRAPRPDRLFTAAGLGGLPANVAASVMVVVSWLVCVIFMLLIVPARGSVGVGPALGVSAGAVLVAWLVTAALARAVRRGLPDHPPARADLVGGLCIVRSVDGAADFGVAELATGDGAPRLIEVRQVGPDELKTGSTALIVEYEPGHDVFWVRAHEPDLGTRP